MFCFYLYTTSGRDVGRGSVYRELDLWCVKIDKHVRFCDDMLKRVPVWLVSAKSQK